MTGEQFIALPQQRVWEGLNDPEVLKASIPGCESIERVSDSEYRTALTASVGPVKAKFNGKLLLSDINPPNSYRIAFEGSGGAAGSDAAPLRRLHARAARIADIDFFGAEGRETVEGLLAI